MNAEGVSVTAARASTGADDVVVNAEGVSVTAACASTGADDVVVNVERHYR